MAAQVGHGVRSRRVPRSTEGLQLQEAHRLPQEQKFYTEMNKSTEDYQDLIWGFCLHNEYEAFRVLIFLVT